MNRSEADMNVTLGQHSYGKSNVRLMLVARQGSADEVIELVATVVLEGDFSKAYTAGDNARVIPTDTMKNTIYAMAKTHGIQNIETFAQRLAQHFLDSFAHVRKVSIGIEQQPWLRAESNGVTHGHAFVRQGSERSTCNAVATRDCVSLDSGIVGLQLLKTRGSGFSGFLKDRFTSLKETDDRILATTISATWPCLDLDRNWTKTRLAVRDLIVKVFVSNYSPSVQRTLYEMGEVVISACPEINEISITMPNQHYLLADLSSMDLKNDNEIFIPTREPCGMISATVKRADD